MIQLRLAMQNYFCNRISRTTLNIESDVTTMAMTQL